MKSKTSLITMNMLITLLGCIGVGLMLFVFDANAQTSSNVPTNISTTSSTSRSWREVLKNFSLTYYQQFLGPTLKRGDDTTYNVFLDGKAPLQNFHAANLRYQINSDWAVGISYAGIHNFTGRVKEKNGIVNANGSEVFNPRLYASLPSFSIKVAQVFTTLAYEYPGSKISRADEMQGGWVLANSFAAKFSHPSLAFGFLTQVSRYYFTNNIKAPPWLGGMSTPMQTVLVSAGPYVNYRFNERWMTSFLGVFDWDQRGAQTETTKFNNNLRDRMRLSLNYYPNMPVFSHIGIFTQALTKPSVDTTVYGMDFSLKF